MAPRSGPPPSSHCRTIPAGAAQRSGCQAPWGCSNDSLVAQCAVAGPCPPAGEAPATTASTMRATFQTRGRPWWRAMSSVPTTTTATRTPTITFVDDGAARPDDRAGDDRQRRPGQRAGVSGSVRDPSRPTCQPATKPSGGDEWRRRAGSGRGRRCRRGTSCCRHPRPMASSPRTTNTGRSRRRIARAMTRPPTTTYASEVQALTSWSRNHVSRYLAVGPFLGRRCSGRHGHHPALHGDLGSDCVGFRHGRAQIRIAAQLVGPWRWPGNAVIGARCARASAWRRSPTTGGR